MSVGGNEYRRDAVNDSTAKTNNTGGSSKPVFGTDAADEVVAVGSTVTLGGGTADDHGGIASGKDHLIATATFMDGSNPVVLDTYV